jgi:hypothetical protein
MKKDEGFCSHPDKDCPGIKCGYPLPCPYHTIEMTIKENGTDTDIPTLTSDKAMEQLDRLSEIADIIREVISLP